MTISIPLNEINVHNFLLLAALVHVFEEFVFPGGFETEFKAMLSRINLQVTNSWLIFTNLLFLSGVVITQFSNSVFFGFTIISVAFINGLLHLGKSIHVRRYFPGVISACFLYIPLGIFSIIGAELTPGEKVLGILCGLGLHGFPLVMLVIFFKRRVGKDMRS